MSSCSVSLLMRYQCQAFCKIFHMLSLSFFNPDPTRHPRFSLFQLRFAGWQCYKLEKLNPLPLIVSGFITLLLVFGFNAPAFGYATSHFMP